MKMTYIRQTRIRQYTWNVDLEHRRTEVGKYTWLVVFVIRMGRMMDGHGIAVFQPEYKAYILT